MSKEELKRAIKEGNLDEVTSLLKEEFVKNIPPKEKGDLFLESLTGTNPKADDIFNLIVENDNFFAGLTTDDLDNWMLKIGFDGFLMRMLHREEIIAKNDSTPIENGYFSKRMVKLMDSKTRLAALYSAKHKEVDLFKQKLSGGFGIAGSLFGIIGGAAMIVAGIMLLPELMLTLVGAGALVGAISIYGLAASSYTFHQASHNDRVSSHTENASLGLLKPDAKEPVRGNETAQAL